MIDETNRLPSLKPEDHGTLTKILSDIHQQALGVIYTDTLPTIDSTPFGKLVVYDDGAGTKRMYLRTGKSNLAYVGLT
jgi:hypothetical protein